jgi:single-strand DNA-binding protein
MVGVNKVILIGNLGKDPDLRRTPSGSAVVSFPLATTERYADRNGEKQERTEWHNVVAWGKLAELANQYLKKGRSAYIEGRITTRSWDDRDGNKKYRTEIIANTIQFLGSGGQAGSGDSAGAGYHEPQEVAVAENVPDAVGEDDLPF